MKWRLPNDPDEAAQAADALAEREAPRRATRPPDKRRRFHDRRSTPDTKEG